MGPRITAPRKAHFQRRKGKTPPIKRVIRPRKALCGEAFRLRGSGESPWNYSTNGLILELCIGVRDLSGFDRIVGVGFRFLKMTNFCLCHVLKGNLTTP